MRFAAALHLLLLAGAAVAQSSAGALPPLTVEQIAERMMQRDQQRAATLQSYVVHRAMNVSYTGLLPDRQASEQVEMTFTAPRTERFRVLSSNGPEMLLEGVFQREIDSEKEATAEGAIGVTPERYHMRLIGQDHLPQGDCYVLLVSPRVKGKFGYEGRIWVQSPDFAVVRVEARLVENPSFWVSNGTFETECQKVDGFWLPSRTVSRSHVRLGGDATLTIQYGPYRIVSAVPTTARGE